MGTSAIYQLGSCVQQCSFPNDVGNVRFCETHLRHIMSYEFCRCSNATTATSTINSTEKSALFIRILQTFGHATGGSKTFDLEIILCGRTLLAQEDRWQWMITAYVLWQNLTPTKPQCTWKTQTWCFVVYYAGTSSETGKASRQCVTAPDDLCEEHKAHRILQCHSLLN